MDEMRMLAQKVETTSWFLDHGVPIIVIVVVALLATVGSRLVVRRFRRRLEGSPSLTQELNLQRATTLADALLTTLTVIVWVIALLLVLGELSVNLAPLLASAGIAGVALGFGAQTVVRDTLAGFFILLENQFGVGDTVEAFTTGGVVSGRVEALSLRVTTLRAYDGSLHIIPNGNLQIVSNKSRGWARAIVDVRVAYAEDLERVRGVLEELFEELRNDEVLHDWVMDGPKVLGIETLADSGQVVRVVADTRPSKRFDTERVLRERITRRLADRDITVPIPTVAPRLGPTTPDGST
jgi:moderate conductance mechanosensitive channel